MPVRTLDQLTGQLQLALQLAVLRKEYEWVRACSRVCNEVGGTCRRRANSDFGRIDSVTVELGILTNRVFGLRAGLR